MSNATPNNTQQSSPEEHSDRPPACADCGDPVQLPFTPRHNRPVYCKPCHRARSAVTQPARNDQAWNSHAQRGTSRAYSPRRAAEPEGPVGPPPLPRLGFGRAGSYE